jgi:hypothetical protein
MIEEYENWEDNIRRTLIELATHMDQDINNNIVHTVWIGDKLPPLAILSIKLWQRHNITPYLWSYSSIENVPSGVVCKNASEIMPSDSMFTFQGDRENINLANNGKGSYAHWSDIFEMTLLNKYGGWYSQLDVAPLNLPINRTYYFAHHCMRNIVNTFVMKTPPNAPFITQCLDQMNREINKNTAHQIKWYDCMRIIGKYINENSLQEHISTNTIECGLDFFVHSKSRPVEKVEFIHWCNSKCENQDDLIYECNKKSFLYELLKQESIV